MKFMLDTNICIYIIKRGPETVLGRFAFHPVGDIGMSVITWPELKYGASKSTVPAGNREAPEQFVSSLEVAAFDRPATLTYGRMRALLEKKGRPIGSMDMLIAAHALSVGARLVTNNVEEFKRVPGLRVENWV